MKNRRKRTLTPAEAELWSHVAATTSPIEGRAKLPLPKKITAPSIEHERRTFPSTAPTEKPKPAASKSAPVMDRKKLTQMARGKLKPEARIDLHGMTLTEAHPALNSFIVSAQGQGKRLVLVITGKGKSSEDVGPIPRPVGVLRQNVPQWLSMPPLSRFVLEVTPAHRRHGGDGALYVYLKRNR